MTSVTMTTMNPMTKSLWERLKTLGWTVAALGMAALSTALLVLTVVSIPLIVVWVGLPLLFGAVLAVRPIANVHRRAAARLLDREIGEPYLAPPEGNLLVQLRGLLVDRATWRDLTWVAINGTAGLALCIAGLVEAILDLLFWWLPPGMLMRVHAYLAVALLSPTKGTTLAQRVQQLAQSRADTRDISATELRRIERDLHDGVQQRLTSLAVHLGMAKAQLADDGQAKETLDHAHTEVKAALTDLRDFLRGLYPAVLDDRGLDAALSGIAARSPIPVRLDVELSERPPREVEAVAYFLVSEALTNVLTHAEAGHASIEVTTGDGRLRVTVSDDGRGGADPAQGSGLRGLQQRIASIDGTMQLDSPPGGPTVVTGELPCAS